MNSFTALKIFSNFFYLTNAEPLLIILAIVETLAGPANKMKRSIGTNKISMVQS